HIQQMWVASLKAKYGNTFQVIPLEDHQWRSQNPVDELYEKVSSDKVIMIPTPPSDDFPTHLEIKSHSAEGTRKIIPAAEMESAQATIESTWEKQFEEWANERDKERIGHDNARKAEEEADRKWGIPATVTPDYENYKDMIERALIKIRDGSTESETIGHAQETVDKLRSEGFDVSKNPYTQSLAGIANLNAEG